LKIVQNAKFTLQLNRSGLAFSKKQLTMSKKIKLGSLLMLASVLLYSCATAQPIGDCLTGSRAGFFYGLLHGFITPVGFIVSLFKDDVAIYAVNNSGGFYDLGFLLDSGGWGFWAVKGSKKR